MPDLGEELLPSHQLSKQLRRLLQSFDKWFDFVVDSLFVNFTDVLRWQLLRPQELQNGSKVGTVTVNEEASLSICADFGVTAEQLSQLGVWVFPQRAQCGAKQVAPNIQVNDRRGLMGGEGC